MLKLPVHVIPFNESHYDCTADKDADTAQLVRDIESAGYPVRLPFRVQASLTKLEPDYYLRGQISAEVQLTCSRCAEPFWLSVQPSFELGLYHTTAKTAQERVTDDSEEVDTVEFEGPVLDLSPIFYEQLILSLPIKPLCKEDCRGLCQTCGKNRNLHSCQCSPALEFNPFANLKGKLE